MVGGSDSISERKAQAYLGSARCHLHRLRPERLGQRARQPDFKNVARLVRIFKREKCRRWERANHVPVLASREIIRDVGPEEDLPLLEPPGDLLLLHGLHRIEAAKIYLHPDDRWWTVDLYDEALVDEPLMRHLREEHPNAKPFDDGDIYRKLRQAQLGGDKRHEQEMLAMLSWTKQRDLQQLEKRVVKDSQMQQLQFAVDELLPFTGLWPAVMLGAFTRRMLTLRCPEEMTRYLGTIKAVWREILGPSLTTWERLDAPTVMLLQGRHPHGCMADREHILGKSKIIMAHLTDDSRGPIVKRCLQIPHLIPSLYTFLEDTKFLQYPAQIMRILLPGRRCATTIRQEFSQIFNGQKSWVRQTSEHNYETVTQDSGDDAFAQAYRQLWLMAIRHFPEILGQTLRKDRGQSKPSPVLESVWEHLLRHLAYGCGFRITDLDGDPYTEATLEMVNKFMPRVRPQLLYATTYSPQCAATIAGLIDQQLGSNFAAESSAGTSPQQDMAASDRCGVPRDVAFKGMQKRMFLPQVDWEDLEPCQSFQPFTALQFFFHSFFGRAPATALTREPNNSMELDRSSIAEAGMAATAEADAYIPQPASADRSATVSPAAATVDASGDWLRFEEFQDFESAYRRQKAEVPAGLARVVAHDGTKWLAYRFHRKERRKFLTTMPDQVSYLLHDGVTSAKVAPLEDVFARDGIFVVSPQADIEELKRRIGFVERDI